LEITANMTTTRELIYHESTEEIRALERYVAAVFDLLSHVNDTFHKLGIGKLDDIRQLELAIENVDFVKELVVEKGYHNGNLDSNNLSWMNEVATSVNENFDKFTASVEHFHQHKPSNEIIWELFQLKLGKLTINSKEVEGRKDQFRYYVTNTSKKTKVDAVKNLIEALEEVESLDIKVFDAFSSPILQKTKMGYKIRPNSLE
jgi:hypothetical protein